MPDFRLLFLWRRKAKKPNIARINNRGIVTPIPILAPVDRPPDEAALGGGLLRVVIGLEVEPGDEEIEGFGVVEGPDVCAPALTAITSVMAADFLSVKVDMYGATPEGMVVVTKNVVNTTVS
jgi:hypothetical protein